MSILYSQQLPSEHENEEKKRVCVGDFSFSFSKVEGGLEFILKHLSGPQFPRSIMVPTIGGQRLISDKDRVMLYYQGALWQDCRISAFYPGQKNPDLVFIDIDAKDFCSERALKTALTKMLKHIKEKIGGHPTVLWSGRGYHIIQPIDCPEDLDNRKEFADLVWDKDVNKAFLQFGAYYLSGGKKDSNNRTSLKSCLLRIPNSLNAKCVATEDKDAEVKIIQEWDGFRPSFKLFLGSFYADLVAEKEKEIKEHEKHPIINFEAEGGSKTIGWIEKLLETPIEDYRKRARDLVIVPYLVLRRGITDIDQIEAVLMQWADKCGDLRSLQPSRRVFAKEVRSRVREVGRKGISQMRWSTFAERNPELAKHLMSENNDGGMQ